MKEQTRHQCVVLLEHAGWQMHKLSPYSSMIREERTFVFTHATSGRVVTIVLDEDVVRGVDGKHWDALSAEQMVKHLAAVDGPTTSMSLRLVADNSSGLSFRGEIRANSLPRS